MDKYEIIIYWSSDDDAFIAEAPELKGCLAHGDSHASALEHMREAMSLWIETAKVHGDEVPKPKGGRLIFA
jgi:predicted RNase H-like HicB family nuclease